MQKHWRKLILLVFCLPFSLPAFPQVVYTGTPVTNNAGQPIAGAMVYITISNPCGAPPAYANCNGLPAGLYSGAIPPVSLASTYTDLTLGHALTQPILTDAWGNWAVYLATGGNYWAVFSGQGILAYVEPFSVGSSSGSGGGLPPGCVPGTQSITCNGTGGTVFNAPNGGMSANYFQTNGGTNDLELGDNTTCTPTANQWNLCSVSGTLHLFNLSGTDLGSPLTASQLGQANGVAALNNNGYLPVAQMVSNPAGCNSTTVVLGNNTCGTGSGSVPQVVLPNASSGTTCNKLVAVNSSGQAIASSGGVIGIAASGCGTSGSVTVTTQGLASCVFASGVTNGDFIGGDPANAGDCYDPPSGTGQSSYIALLNAGIQVIGQVLASNAGGGTYQIVLYPNIQAQTPTLNPTAHGSSYTLTSADKNNLTRFNCIAACTATLNASASTGDVYRILSTGSVTPTVALGTAQFNGGSTAPALIPFAVLELRFDGSSYWATSPLAAGAGISISGTATARTIINALGSATHGNTSTVQLESGTTTSGHCADFDANGNLVDAGAACGASAGASVFPLTSGGAALSTSATQFEGAADVGSSEASHQVPMPRSGTVSELYCHDSGTFSGTQQLVITVRQNGASSTLTCTLNSTNTTTCNDTTHNFSVAAGDLINLQTVPSNTPPAGTLGCAVEIQ
jgi:hypothetical protein